MTATRLVKVADVATQIRGVTYEKGEASKVPTAETVLLLRAGNIGDHGLLMDDVLYVPSSRVSQKQMLQRHDILIVASSGSLSVVGKAAQIPSGLQGSFGAFCKVLRPNAGVDPNFFHHFFRTSSYRRRISSVAAGANINNLRSEDLDNLILPLPSLSEQRRIAAILDQAEALRTKRRQALAKLDPLPTAKPYKRVHLDRS